ncbi:hypothetical protein OIO90_000295 [Microbotryomycetes sp. JL221]|nr:hypothetical protein OIO90_000295 [Microbotryomycetes sp. JL221]
MSENQVPYTSRDYGPIKRYATQAYATSRSCQTLRLWPVNDLNIVELSVENGRCAFLASPCGVEGRATFGLWAFNLRPWTSIEGFKIDPPRPTCLAYPLPLFGDPARLEMTGDEIYVQANQDFAPPDGSDIDDGVLRSILWKDKVSSLQSTYSGNFCWESMSGEQLSEVWETRDDVALKELNNKWSEMIRTVASEARGRGIEGNDAFLVFSFA